MKTGKINQCPGREHDEAAAQRLRDLSHRSTGRRSISSANRLHTVASSRAAAAAELMGIAVTRVDLVDHRGRADRPLLVMRPAALREAVPPADHRLSAYSNRVAISALDRFRNNTIRARCTGPGGMLDAEYEFRCVALSFGAECNGEQ